MNTTNRRTPSEPPAQELSLRDILAPLFRHRRIVIITFCAVFAMGTVLAWAWAARYYRASMEVLVEQDRSDPAVTTAQNGAVTAKNVSIDQVSSEVALLQGADMYRSIVVSCGLADEKWSITNFLLPRDPEKRKAVRIESAAGRLAKKVTVESEKTSDVIEVKYGRAGDPETPACVLRNLGQLYLEKHLHLQRPEGASNFFAEQTEKYRRALADSEARLVDFSRAAGVAAPDMIRTDLAVEVAKSEASLNQTDEAVAADEKRIQNLEKQMAITPARSLTTESSLSANLLIENLQTTLLDDQNKRSQLVMKYDPDYPLVKEADREIAQTQQAISDAEKAKYMNQTTDNDTTFEFLRKEKAKSEADLASDKAAAASLTKGIQGLRTQMVKLDSDAVQQAALMREAKADEGNYLLYLNKREQERMSDALDLKRIANVAIAVPPEVPVLPAHNPWMVWFLGTFLAIAAGVASAFVAEYLDRSFRTPAEVVDTLKIPVLASIPKRAA